MTPNRLALAGLGLAMTIALGACGPATTRVKPGPMPEGGSFHGVWHSLQFGRMELCDSRGTVVGMFVKDTRVGDIQGKVQGDLLRFKWREENHIVRGRPNVLDGHGYFKLVQTPEGRYRLEGEWGYGEDEVGGGPWEANQIRSATPDNCYAHVRKDSKSGSSGGDDPFGDEPEDDGFGDF